MGQTGSGNALAWWRMAYAVISEMKQKGILQPADEQHLEVLRQILDLCCSSPLPAKQAVPAGSLKSTTGAGNSALPTKNANDAIFEAKKLLIARDAAQALALLQDTGDTGAACRELIGVRQMHLGKAMAAHSIFQELLFPKGATSIPDLAPPHLIANFATTQLLIGDIRGAKNTLDQVGDKDLPAISRLLTAIDKWEQSLSFKERMMWRFGGAPPKPFHLDPPYGEI